MSPVDSTEPGEQMKHFFPFNTECQAVQNIACTVVYTTYGAGTVTAALNQPAK